MSAAKLDYGFDPDAEYVEDDAAMDRWNDGALDGCNRKPPASDDKDYLEGHAHGIECSKTVVVMPERPEGYYHAPVGTFD